MNLRRTAALMATCAVLTLLWSWSNELQRLPFDSRTTASYASAEHVPHTNGYRQLPIIITHDWVGAEELVHTLLLRCDVQRAVWTLWSSSSGTDGASLRIARESLVDVAPADCSMKDSVHGGERVMHIHIVPTVVSIVGAMPDVLRVIRHWATYVSGGRASKVVYMGRRSACFAVSVSIVDHALATGDVFLKAQRSNGSSGRVAAADFVVLADGGDAIVAIASPAALMGCYLNGGNVQQWCERAALRGEPPVTDSLEAVLIDDLRHSEHEIVVANWRRLRRLLVTDALADRVDSSERIADAYRLLSAPHMWWDAEAPAIQYMRRRLLPVADPAGAIDLDCDSAGKTASATLNRRLGIRVSSVVLADYVTDYWVANRRCALTRTRKGSGDVIPQQGDNKNRLERTPRRARDVDLCGIPRFSDRESLYEATHGGTTGSSGGGEASRLPCGWRQRTTFHAIRELFLTGPEPQRLAGKCSLVIFTFITDCYDPLPVVHSHRLPLSTCLVAFMDNVTFHAIGATQADRLHIILAGSRKKSRAPPPKHRWRVYNVDDPMWGSSSWADSFSSKIRAIELVKLSGAFFFPFATRVIWLDGKAVVHDVPRVLQRASQLDVPSDPLTATPSATVLYAMRSYFHDSRSKYRGDFDIEKEFIETRAYLCERYGGKHVSENGTRCEVPLPERGTEEGEGAGVIHDMEEQLAVYREAGFIDAMMALKRRARGAAQHMMLDIAAITYPVADPCALKLMCAWHNEVCYFSYRGQLSVHYALHRLQLLPFLGIEPNYLFQATPHHAVCFAHNGTRINDLR